MNIRRCIIGSIIVLATSAPAFADGDSEAIAAYLAKRQVVAEHNLASAISTTGHASCYIAFVSGTAQLDSQSKAQIHELAHMVKDDPDLKIEIAFQSSDLGNESSAKKMAYKRALALVHALRDLDVERGRVVARDAGNPVSVAFNEISTRI